MPHLNLTSCRAKLKRARVHLEELNSLTKATFSVEANCPTVGIKFDDQTGEHVHYISHCPDYSDLFEQVGLIAGDAVQNTRAALDHLVYALTVWHTGGHVLKPNATQFPICDSPRGFEPDAKRRLSEIHLLHIAGIERFQAYQTIALWAKEETPIRWLLNAFVPGSSGPNPFSVLRDLSNMDKHRLLHVVVIPTHAQIMNTWLPFEDIVSLSGTVRLPKTADLGAELMRHTLRPGVRLPDVELAGYIPPLIALADVDYPLKFLLKALEMRVSGVIELFEPLT